MERENLSKIEVAAASVREYQLKNFNQVIPENETEFKSLLVTCLNIFENSEDRNPDNIRTKIYELFPNIPAHVPSSFFISILRTFYT